MTTTAPDRPINHGTVGAYCHRGCRCAYCTAAMRDAQRARRGSRGRVDAAPVRAHLEQLRDQGYPIRWVAERSGWSYGALLNIIGGQATCSADLAEDVLGVIPR